MEAVSGLLLLVVVVLLVGLVFGRGFFLFFVSRKPWVSGLVKVGPLVGVVASHF